MKQINLIILLFAFGQLTSFAQKYESVFGKDTTQWNFVTDYGGADFIATVQFKALTCRYHFFFEADKDLEKVCNAPKDKDGVFKVLELPNGKINTQYRKLGLRWLR